MRVGSRSIGPEHDGQLRGEPVRSLAIKCNACAGLYVFGRGLRMNASKESVRVRPDRPAHRLSLKSNRSRRVTPAGPGPTERTAAPAQKGRTRLAHLYTAGCGKRSGGEIGPIRSILAPVRFRHSERAAHDRPLARTTSRPLPGTSSCSYQGRSFDRPAMSHRPLRPAKRFPSRVPGRRRRRSW
jgi:hypothetical protein